MDRIYIRDLALRCIIGLYPEERKTKQDVIINIVLETDLRAAGKSDSLTDTLFWRVMRANHSQSLFKMNDFEQKNEFPTLL